MAEAGAMNANEIATIRDILFGAQAKNIDEQLNAIRQDNASNLKEIKKALDDLGAAIDNLRQQTNERLDQLENSLEQAKQQTANELETLKAKNKQQLSTAFLNLGKQISQLTDQ
ncbi:MAG: hypothetical protein AAGG68_10680 [Bacteroidota bacterium]